MAASLALAACSEPAATAKPTINVLLITVDTLRADHVSCYGYDKPTTPALDAFARRATRYTDCLAPASWTVPSHASLFTGRFPTEHGAHSVRTETQGEPRFSVSALADEHTTLAEALTAEGYATAGFAANHAFLTRRLKFDQGFATYAAAASTADRITGAALAWLDTPREQPFFLFLNYMDAHCPCNLAPRAREPLPRPDERNGRTLMDMLVNTLAQTDEPLPQKLVDALVEQYDNGIAFADEHIGRLLRELERRGLFDSTLIVITSDHGEFFGEHRLAEHARDVYQPVLSVPLIVKSPGQSEGAVDDQPFSLVDVPNLIVRALGGTLARDWTQQFPYAPGTHPRLAENHYTRRIDADSAALATRFDRVRRAFFEGSLKYIASSDGRDELYDLANDPGEQRNLLDEQPELRARFADALQRFDERMSRRASSDASESLDPATLRELGYF